MVRSFKDTLLLLEAGGSEKGKLEIHSTTLDNIEKLYTSNVFNKIPNLKSTFPLVKKLASKGKTKRNEMPVINSSSIEEFKKYLQDNNIKYKETSIKVSKLIPLQYQIYVDKSINGILEYGIEGSLKFIESKPFIVSKTNRIIDGHHRYLSAMLIDVDTKVSIIHVDLDTKNLVELSNKFTDFIGNIRNH